MIKKGLICYLSFSGNTKELAEMIEAQISNDFEVDMYEIGFGIIPDLTQYDFILFGSFTWDKGSTPDEFKDFILDTDGYKPSHSFVFGSGDTQFGGDELFCNAVTKLHKFYDAHIYPLKVEQSPRGSQESLVEEWTIKIREWEVHEYI